MQDNTPAPKYAPATSRTFAARVVEREYGVIRSVDTYDVTVWKEAGQYRATVNGEEVEAAHAFDLLSRASELAVTAETLVSPDPAPIGKARAHKLHKLMGRARIANHYRFASTALGERVESLAALTEGQARRVWADLLLMFPELQVAA